LFSEKKPGDLSSRQIIVELWSILFDLFPPGLDPGQSKTRPNSVKFDAPPELSQNVDIVAAVRGLLVPAEEKKGEIVVNPHDFITVAHRPRVFKAWVGELSDICRDYFW
jgi:hypothetical protein